MAMRRARWLIVVLAFALFAAACSDDDGDDGADAGAGGTSAPADTAPVTEPSGSGATTTAARTGEDGDAAAVSGTIRLGSYLQATGLDPHTAGGGQPAIQYLQPVYDTLLRRNPDFTFSPMIATEWGYLDEDNLDFQMTLRDDVTFVDGTPVDAEAVKANLERALEMQGEFSSHITGVIDTIEVVDPVTVVLHLLTPSPTLEVGLSGPAGMLVSPAAFDNPDLDTNPVGSGPYTFDRDAFVAGSVWAYDARPDYWDPSLQGPARFEITLIPDFEARFNALTAGQIDITLGGVDQVPDAEAAGLEILPFDLDWQGLMLMDRDGTNVPALGDVRVRQALNHAIDRQAIVDAVLGGQGTVTHSIFPPSSPAHVAELESRYPYDPDQARALLAEAGYADGFVLHTPSVGATSTVIEAIGGYLADIGVTLEIETLESGFVEAVISGDYDAPFMSYGMEHPHSDAQFLLLPDGTFNPFDTENEEIADLWAEAATLPADEAASRYQDINRLVTEEAWFLPVFRPTAVYFVNPDVSNFEVYALQAAPAIYGWKIDG